MKNRISFFTIIFLLISTFQSIGQTRDVGDFNEVHASSSVTVTLVKAKTPSVEYTMKKGSEKNLITLVKDGVLYVKIKSNKRNWSNSAQADVTVYYTELDEISASAGCILKSSNTIVANSMEIEVASGSTAKLDVEAKTIEVYVSSGSTLKLKGEATKGKFEASSGSTLNAYHFKTEDAVVEASSGASLTIHVDNSLVAESGSGASINYTGNVKKTNIDTGWSGSIKRKN